MKINFKVIIFWLLTVLSFLLFTMIVLFANGFNKKKDFLDFLFDYPELGYPKLVEHYIEFPDTGFSDIKVDHFTMRRSIDPNNSMHILTIGASNLSGWNIKNEQTIYYKLKNQKFFDTYDILNLSYPGWGINNIFERLENLTEEKLSKNAKGYLFYFFSDIHFERTCGGDLFYTWASTTPIFKLENNNLVKDGYFKHSKDYIKFKFRNGVTKLYSNLSGKENSIQVNLDHISSQNCHDLFFAIFKNVLGSYKKMFPEGKVIVFNLNFKTDNKYKSKFSQIVDHYSNLSSIHSSHPTSALLQEDFHVTEFFNSILIQHLINTIKKID